MKTKKEKAKELADFAGLVEANAVGTDIIFAIMTWLRRKDEKKGVTREDVDYLYAMLQKACEMSETYSDVLIALSMFKKT